MFICPIMSNRIEYSNGNNMIECKKANCAWYDLEHQCCVIAVAAERITEVCDGDRIVYTKEV